MHVGNAVIFSDRPQIQKARRIVTLSELWDYSQTAFANCKKYAKTSFDLHKDVMHAEVHISSSTVQRPVLDADRKTKKQLGKQLLTRNEEKIRMGEKHKY